MKRTLAALGAVLFIATVVQPRALVVAGMQTFGAWVAHVRLDADRMQVGFGGADFQGVRVASMSGEPIATVDRVTATYGWDGLRSFDLERPNLTLVRHRDGTYNVPKYELPKGNGPATLPEHLIGRIRDGSIDVVDATPRGSHLAVERINADIDLSRAALSRFSMQLAYAQLPGGFHSIAGSGFVDPVKGYALAQLRASSLPIAGAINFALQSQVFRIESGTLDNVDVRYVGIGAPHGPMETHLAANAYLNDGRVAIAGLAKPVRGIHGRVEAYDGGLLTRRLEASIAGIPVAIEGGGFGVRSPQVRLTAHGHGDIAQLRTLTKAAARLPASGPIDFSLLAEGNAEKPLVWLAASAPHGVYASQPFSRARVLIAYDGGEADAIDARTAIAGVGVTARGRAILTPGSNAFQALVRADGAQAGARAGAIALASGSDVKNVAARGVLYGEYAGQRLDGIFDVPAHGAASIGPVVLGDARGSLYARVAFDPARRTGYGAVDAGDFEIPATGKRIDGRLFGARTRDGIAILGDGALSGGEGRGAIAALAGISGAPHGVGTLLLQGARVAGYPIDADATIRLANGLLRIDDGDARVGPAFVAARGSLGRLSSSGFVPHYDLDASVHTSDAASLLAAVSSAASQNVQGSFDASLHVEGAQSAPSFSGTIDAPEGSVNGLAFRELHAGMSGTPAGIALRGGRVIVDSTAIAFDAQSSAAATSVSADAPHANLADFNDYFDTGDTFSGTGALSLGASLAGTRIVATNGDVHVAGARFRNYDLGKVDARWSGSGSRIDTEVALRGASGSVNVAGTIAPASQAMNLRASVRSMDLATVLPMAGIVAPITGKLDADATVDGTYPALDLDVRANLVDGTAWRVPIDRFSIAANAVRGYGTISSGVFDIPNLSTALGGTFGLRPGDRFALEARSTSPDVGALMKTATGANYGVSGALVSNLRVTGTRADPQVADDFVVSNALVRSIRIPRIAGEVAAANDRYALRNGEIDLDPGKVLFGGELRGSELSATLTANDVALANFASLFPKGTQLKGRVDGTVDARGTLGAPRFGGSLALAGGAFIGPQERAPIKDVAATLVLNGTRADFTQMHATVGGGSVAATGWANVPSVRDLSAANFFVRARAQNAHVEMPSYFTGNVDGNVSLSGNAGGTLAVSGNAGISSARIPLSAFLGTKSAGPKTALPAVAFHDVTVNAGRDVRVQSGEVDIGGSGSATLSGTLSSPRLAGAFHSTGGSIDFYRDFALQRGEVSFDPRSGIVPYVDAVATTFVDVPATDVRLHVRGPATQMNLGLESSPQYDRQRILSILVGAEPGAGAVPGSMSLPGAARGMALGQANVVFVRHLLEPLSLSAGSALGFTDLQITNDLQSGMGLHAVKAFGKNVNAVATGTFGYPRTESVALESSPNTSDMLRLRAYTSQGPTLFSLQQPALVGLDAIDLNPLTAIPAGGGTNGVGFDYVRKFP